MLDFIITGLPRSATTWASVWMTGDGAHCAHDPLYHTHYEDWPTALVQPDVLNGASDTGIWRWPDWLNAQAAAGTRILVLERDFEDCNAQRYKMLGNGWTVDVIAHIFKELANQGFGGAKLCPELAEIAFGERS